MELYWKQKTTLFDSRIVLATLYWLLFGRITEWKYCNLCLVSEGKRLRQFIPNKPKENKDLVHSSENSMSRFLRQEGLSGYLGKRESCLRRLTLQNP